jgi:predicted AlkP superfamily phosphohydrolase/phosphomutase
MNRPRRPRARFLPAALVLLVLLPSPAFAYIGPGAGFALAGSFFAVFLAVLSAVVTLLTWPMRLVVRTLFGRRALAKARVQRVVILGLDGMDHGLTETMLEEGKLPNLAALRDKGCFRPLGSTVPPISPVAWSSFQTGVNPGKHNIFDFLTPDLHGYHAKLSSVEIRPPRRVLKFGKYHIPLGGATVRLLRKSRPFWNVLSDHGIFSNVLRVPITFPPEKLRGVLLSAMCVPDLRGTQGMFAHYTTRRRDEGEKIGGDVHTVVREGDTVRADLIGPDHPFRPDLGPVKAPFVVTITGSGRARLKIDGATYELEQGRYTDWIRVGFRVMPGVKVYGICKFLLLHTEPEFGLYVTPINIDPEKPAMPVGYPAVFSKYLAKRQGPFATLGLAEDTWALNEGVINDDQFIEQCLDADREREAMWFDAIDKTPRGLVVCVFDGTDRLQHTFWRDIDDRHPARPAQHILDNRDIIGDLYRRMDDLVGKTVARCDRDNTLLMVISDHGFGPFRRGIDLNRWLLDNGYLTLHEGRGNEDHLAGVDWSRTRAFAIGLSGIYINLKDKYSQGIVEPGEEAERLKDEIAERLTALVDEEEGQSAVKRVYIASKFYRGPYRENGPDLIPGYQRGYRVAWETAIGRTTDRVFHPNTKAWSGDHCVDPSLVPGILFCNRAIEEAKPRLMDIGPTVLHLFGVPVPDYMDGKPLTVGGPAGKPGRAPERELSEVGR